MSQAMRLAAGNYSFGWIVVHMLCVKNNPTCQRRSLPTMRQRRNNKGNGDDGSKTSIATSSLGNIFLQPWVFAVDQLQRGAVEDDAAFVQD
jgi:hypothetical protein